MPGDTGMAVKAPHLCQAHARLVVKPFKKQDMKTKMKTMLRSVGWGGDLQERKLSFACFTIHAAHTSWLHFMGAGGERGLEVAGVPWLRWDACPGPSPAGRQAPCTTLFSLPCSDHASSAIKCVPAGTETKSQGKTPVPKNRLSCARSSCLDAGCI